METQFLDPETVRLTRCDGALALVRDAKKIPLAPPRRAMPLSSPEEYIVISDCDGEEIGWVRRIAELEENSRVALETTLAELYVVTRITRVREVEKEALSGQIRWRVEIEHDDNADEATSGDSEAANANANANANATDESTPKMGARLMKKLGRDREETETSVDEREFFIAVSEDVQSARYPQIFIVDTERNRYLIADCEALDIESRRAAERYF